MCIGQEMFVINQMVYLILWYHENVLISYIFDNLETHSLAKPASLLRPNVLILSVERSVHASVKST